MQTIIDDMVSGDSTKQQEEAFMAQVMKEADRQLISQRRQDCLMGGIITAAIIMLARIYIGV